jgi:hypothetical protein
VYRPVRYLFEFALLQMYRILDVHVLLYSCARGQGRLNRIERTIFHWSINRDLKRVIHITRHSWHSRFVRDITSIASTMIANIPLSIAHGRHIPLEPTTFDPLRQKYSMIFIYVILIRF